MQITYKQLMMLGAVLAGGALSANAATKVLYVSGATAFRGVEFNTLSANISGAEVVGTSSSSQFSFAGTWTGAGGPYPIKVYCSYSGSLEGQDALLNGVTATFQKLPVADGGAGTFTHAVTMAFSDAYQNSGKYGQQFGYPALGDTVVAVQPFVFVKNGAAHLAGINNITDQIFRLLGASGSIPQTYFKGDGSSSLVYLSGRNDFSGTRTVTLAETGYGVFNLVQQYGNAAVSGSYPNTARGANQATAVPLAANDGWGSGGNVRADMNNTLCTDMFVGYLSAGDARSLLGPNLVADSADFQDWYLTHNGVPYTYNNVINGSYTLWGYEHLFFDANNTDAVSFAPNFKTAIGALLTTSHTDNWPAGINVSEMVISRTAEATGTVSGPILP